MHLLYCLSVTLHYDRDYNSISDSKLFVYSTPELLTVLLEYFSTTQFQIPYSITSYKNSATDSVSVAIGQYF